MAHRNLCHSLSVPEHALKDVEEIFSGDVLRNNAQRIDVTPWTMYTQTVRPECEDFSPSGFRCGL